MSAIPSYLLEPSQQPGRSQTRKSSEYELPTLPSSSFSLPAANPSPASTRDSSPARDPVFRQADRARRSQLSRSSYARSEAGSGGGGGGEGGGGLRARWGRWRKEEGKVWVEMGGSCATILLVGMNDSATGANLPSMQETYKVTYTIISLVFLANTLGYFVSSLSNSFLLHHYGLRNSLLLAGLFYASGSLILTQRPPFPVTAVGLALLGAGSGLYDASLTTVISHYEDGPLMSLMYAFFGIGATISPFIIGSFIDRDIAWNTYYYIPLALAVIFGLIHILLFSSYDQPTDTSASGHHQHEDNIPSTSTSATTQSNNDEATSSATDSAPVSAQASLEASPSTVPTPRAPSFYASQSPIERLRSSSRYSMVWLGSFLVILGFASTDIYGAWLPTYAIDIKNASPTAGRYSLAGLWGGIALGRILLAYPSSRIGEKPASIAFLILVMAGLAVLWKVESFKVGQGVVVLTGFCLGPVTPNAISLTTSRVPPSLKSSVVGLLIGLGLIGSAIGPLFLGLASQRTSLVILPGVLIVISGISVGGLAAVRSRKRQD